MLATYSLSVHFIDKDLGQRCDSYDVSKPYSLLIYDPCPHCPGSRCGKPREETYRLTIGTKHGISRYYLVHPDVRDEQVAAMIPGWRGWQS